MSSGKPIQFHKAAKRHFLDANLLLSHKRLANAAQLYGFCAECGIKALLIWHGLPETDTGDIDTKNNNKKSDKFRKHVHELVAHIHLVENFLQGRNGAKYLALISKINNFSNWHTEHRYYDETYLPTASFPRYQDAAQEIMKMFDQAVLDGVTI